MSVLVGIQTSLAGLDWHKRISVHLSCAQRDNCYTDGFRSCRNFCTDRSASQCVSPTERESRAEICFRLVSVNASITSSYQINHFAKTLRISRASDLLGIGESRTVLRSFLIIRKYAEVSVSKLRETDRSYRLFRREHFFVFATNRETKN